MAEWPHGRILDEYSTFEWFTRVATPLTRCPSPAHAHGVRRAAGCSACGKRRGKDPRKGDLPLRALSDVFVADGGGPNTE